LIARLVLSPSRALAAIIVVLHGAAGASAFLVLGGIDGAALCAMLLALGVAAAWSRALLGSARSVRALEIGGEGLVVELASGERVAAATPQRCYVSRLAVVLPLRRTVLVAADMLSPAEFRRLRLWALWRKLPSAVAGKQLPA
jgi:hypothetical protein